MSKLAATMDAWARKCERRMTAIIQESSQRVIQAAQEVGPSVANPGGTGTGKMPVDSGFLRASMVAQVGSMPAGPTHGGTSTYRYDEGTVVMTIAGMKLGDTLYAGWTAEYARWMEVRYGFARSAAQQWQGIVNQVTEEARARVQ
jgi:hypothetical protein